MNYGKDLTIRPVQERTQLNAVICGSFRRDPGSLRREFQELEEAGCTVLSPLDPNFVAEIDGFVFGRGEVGQTRADIEQQHMRSMEKADFVWLHCPEGYVGTSATMELGFAQALGLRVYSAELPTEAVLSDIIIQSPSPGSAAALFRGQSRDAPSHTLLALQSYYAKAAEDRGWSGETATDTFGLLRGEVSELEAAVQDDIDHAAVGLELADVQLYVVHLANILGVNLSEAVRGKERINQERFDPPANRMAA